MTDKRAVPSFEAAILSVVQTLREGRERDWPDAELVPAVVRAWLLVDSFSLADSARACWLTAAVAERELAGGRPGGSRVEVPSSMPSRSDDSAGKSPRRHLF